MTDTQRLIELLERAEQAQSRKEALDLIHQAEKFRTTHCTTEHGKPIKTTSRLNAGNSLLQGDSSGEGCTNRSGL